MQDYSPSLSAEKKKGPVQIFLYKNQFYKHKNQKAMPLFTCGINLDFGIRFQILVNVKLQLDTISVAIFFAHHFSLLLVAKNFDLSPSGGYLTNNVK